MASVQELILAAQAQQKKSPLTALAEMINAGSEGYAKGVKLKKENALAESELSESELRRQTLISKLISDREASERQAQLRKELEETMAMQTEAGIRDGLNSTKVAGQPPTPKAKVEKEFSTDEKGNVTSKVKVIPIPESKPVDTVIYQDALGKNRIGKKSPTGEVIQSAVDPLAPSQPKDPADALEARDQAKLSREKPKAKGSLTEALREFDNMIKEAEEIKNDPALPSATGLDSFRGKIPGTEAKRVHARMQTLKAKTLLNVLGSLKQLSATGASGFGALSEVEGEQIRNSVSTLDLDQQDQDVKDSINRFVKEMKARKDTLKSTFEDTYGESFDGTPSPIEGTSAGTPGKIRVKRLSDGKSGTINESDFDPAKYERIP